MPVPASFLFVTCQAGAESFLKRELGREHPALRAAFSRPGFVTFKQAEGLPFASSFELRSVFARAWGFSIGRGSARAALAQARAYVAEGGQTLVLHCFERERHRPGDEPPGFERNAWSACLVAELREAAGGEWEKFFRAEAIPRDGDLVLDLIGIEEKDDEKDGGTDAWVGWHRHSPNHEPWPGGAPRLALPPEAPSRAYLKLEEAVAWSGARVEKGQTAVEIGSAPGGASYALLRRGLNVVGIDPGEMDPRVVAFRSEPRFTHVRAPVASVRREELPESIQWLLLDMNVAPQVAVRAVERLALRMKPTLRGVILTVKLNEPEFADEIPAIQERVRRLGMSRVRARQLACNRQEVCVVGLL